MDYRYFQITLQWNILTQIGAVRSADWIFIIGVPVWGGDWASTWCWTKCFAIFFQQETVATQVTATFSSLSHSWRRTLLKYKIIKCINNNNNAISNNNYKKVQDQILFSKIPMSTLKDFFEIYVEFGHASSKWFASPVPDSQIFRVFPQSLEHWYSNLK